MRLPLILREALQNRHLSGLVPIGEPHEHHVLPGDIRRDDPRVVHEQRHSPIAARKPAGDVGHEAELDAGQIEIAKTAVVDAHARPGLTVAFGRRVLAKGEHEHMFIAGDGPKAWYSSLELERIAKGYAYDKKLDFKLERTEMNIWIKTDGGKVLATAHFASDFGKPYLSIQIGRDGKILSHRLGTLVEGPLNEK